MKVTGEPRLGEQRRRVTKATAAIDEYKLFCSTACDQGLPALVPGGELE